MQILNKTTWLRGLAIILAYVNLGLDSATNKEVIQLYNEGANEKAIGVLKKAIAENSNDLEARKILMMLYSLTGDVNSLEKEAIESINLAPNDVDSHNYLMMASFLGEKLDIATREAETILELDPNNAHAYYHLGLIYEVRFRSKKPGNTEDLEKSVDYFIQTVELEPNNLSAYNHLIREYLILGKVEEAHKTGQRALSIEMPKDASDRAETMYALSLVYAAKADGKSSLDWLEKAIEADPEFRKKANQEKEQFGVVKDTEKFRRLVTHGE